MDENVPAPLQTALVAAPPIEPDKYVSGLLAHTAWFVPAFTNAGELIVMVFVAVAGGQSPSELAAVKVTVAVPAEISAAVGV